MTDMMGNARDSSTVDAEGMETTLEAFLNVLTSVVSAVTSIL